MLAAMAALAVVAIVGCSDNTDPENPDNPDTPVTPDSPVTPSTGTDGGETATADWGTYFPSGENVYVDGELTLTFSSTPTLGTSGKITIYNASGTQVDYIDLADVAAGQYALDKGTTTYNTAMDLLYASPESSQRYRVVWYNPVEVSGKTVTVRPHFGVLDFDTDYYVTIDADAISATGFSGVTENDDWSFTTKSAPSSNAELSVAKSGTADFRTIQRALNYCCKAGQTTAVTINVANGTYEEQIFLRSKYNVTIKGESRDKVILQYSNSNTLQPGSGQSISGSKPSVGDALSQIGGRPVMLFESCKGIRFEDMTLNNTWSDDRAQAEVFYFNSDSGTIAFVNCTLHSRQDTVLTKGYNWFYNCSIEGNVDFIWGYAVCCLFEECEIKAVYDFDYSRTYIVQARCSSGDPGYVFLNCDLTADSGVGSGTVYLARSGGDTTVYDNVAYINCDMTSSQLASQGWYNSTAPTPSTASATNGWKYYNVTGVSTSAWVNCYELTESEYNATYKDRSTLFTAAGLSDQSWLTE